MANTDSAKKMVRKIKHRTAINKMRKTRIKTSIRSVLDAIKSGDKLTAIMAFRKAQPYLHRAVCKGILHKNNVARKLSRLSSKIKMMKGEFVVGSV